MHCKLLKIIMKPCVRWGRIPRGRSNLRTISRSFVRCIEYPAHTPHTRLTAPFPGLLGWACTRKVKPIWILLKQETVSGSVISWAICKSAPCSRQITTPAPHHSSFLQAGCPSCRPTNSVKALKAKIQYPACGQYS